LVCQLLAMVCGSLALVPDPISLFREPLALYKQGLASCESLLELIKFGRPPIEICCQAIEFISLVDTALSLHDSGLR